MAETRIAMVLFPNLTQLDLTGPYEVLSRMPGARIDLLHHRLEPVRGDRGLVLTPTATFADYALPVDILFIPGGPGQLAAMDDDGLIHFVRRAGATAKYVTSVCTGSLVLAAAGLLVGKRATTHWAVLEQLALLGAIPVKERVVVDGNTVTGAGVSAGLDFALALVAELQGREAAERIQLMIEYDPAPPFHAGAPDKAPAAVLAALREATGPLTQRRAEAAARIGAERLGLGQRP
jgi:cyclohexyl-isocyanide hydratase